VWIRSSTGHICVDLTLPETDRLVIIYADGAPLPSGTSLLAPPSESETITVVSLREYHDICARHRCRTHYWSVSPNVSVNLGSIRYSSGPEYESSLEVAPSDCTVYDLGWATMDTIALGNLHP
jgi:hypothetical protein